MLLRETFTYLVGSCDQQFNLIHPTGGRVVTPNFPNSFPKNAFCTWSFFTSENIGLQLDFQTLNQNDGMDILVKTELSNGVSTKYSGGREVEVKVATRNNTVLFNTSTGLISYQGYSLNYSTIDGM